MRLLFITGLYPIGSESLLQSNCRHLGLQIASNSFQWALVEGLIENNVELTIFSYPYLPCFPLHYKSLFSPFRGIEYNGKIVGSMYSYCTLPVIKQWHIQSLIRNHVEKYLRGLKDQEPTYILTYTPSPSFVTPLVSLRKKYNIRICSIVTDLIELYNDPIYKRVALKRLQGKWLAKKTANNYSYIDKYILLSDAMKDIIPSAKERSIVVEGIASIKSYPHHEVKDSNKSLLYTGALAAHSSVNDLVDAFCLTTNTNYRLVICGDGVWKDYILEKAKVDNRIDYRGVVSRKDALALQQSATALINPRKPNITVTKYSFPSKTMEYLSSGTPMIGYKLEGIPKEYYQFFYAVEDLSNEGLAHVIETVLSKPQIELNQKALEAFNFIANNKTAKKQASRIINFIRE